MPYNKDGSWYYDPKVQQQNIVKRYKSKYSSGNSDLGSLQNIASSRGISIPEEQPKLGAFQRLISLLRVGETAPAVEAAFQGKNPLTAYLGHVGKSLKSAFTGEAYNPTDYKQVFEKYITGKPFGTGQNIALKGAGIAADILLDPTTYLTAGLSKGVKIGSTTLKSTATPAIKKTSQELAEKLAKESIEAGSTKTLKTLTSEYAKRPEILKQSLSIWDEGIKKGLPQYTKYIDKGGLKFADKTIIPGSSFQKVFGKPITRIKESDLGTSIGKLFNRDYGLSEAQKTVKQNALDFASYKTGERLQRVIDIAKPLRKESDFFKISHAIEGGESAISQLPKKLQVTARQYKDFLGQLAEQGKSRGILKELRKNYVPHVYKNPKADKIIEEYARKFPNKVTSGFGFSKQRQVESLQLAKDLGLEPEENIAKAVAAYVNSFSRSEGNAKYLQDLVSKFGQSGTKPVSTIIKKTEKIQENVVNPKLVQNSLDDMFKQIGYRDFNIPIRQSAEPTKKSLRELLKKQNGNITGKMDDIKTLLNLDKKSIKSWDDVKSLQRIINDKEIKRDVGNFFMTRKNLIEAVGGKFGDITEYIPKTKNITSILEKTKNVPLSTKEIVKIENGIGEPLMRYSDKVIGDVLLPQSIVKDLTANPKLIDEPSVQYLLKQYDRVLNFWKGSVTSLFPAFHARNATSNVLQNFLDIGLKSIDPLHHKEVVKIMAGGKGKLITDLGEEISYDRIRELAKQKRILGGNFFYTDAANAIDDQLKIGLRRGLKRLSPFQAGRTIGGAIEDEARMVNFVANLQKGLGADEAAKLTKKFLFDYSNLSKFEKEIMRRFIPFYTWTRKNIGLQLSMLAKNPGKLASQLKVVRGLGEPVTAEERQKNLPEWAAESAGFKSGTDKYGRPLFFTGLGLPIEAATQSLKTGGALSMLSPAIKTPLELVSGQDFFRGRPIKDVYNATEVGEIINFASKKLNMDEDETRKMLGIGEYDRNVYVEGKKTGEKETVYTMNPYALYLLRTLPTSRLQGTIGQTVSPQKSSLEKLLKGLTGVKAYSFDEAEQQYYKDLEKRDKLENLLQRLGVIGVNKKYYERK